MKKISRRQFLNVAGFSAAALAAAALSGCSEKATSSAASSETISDASANGEPVHLVWVEDGNAMPDQDKVFEKISEYIKDKINATIDLRMADYSELSEKIPLELASGTSDIDILFSATWLHYADLVSSGALYDFTDDLNNDCTALKEALPDFIWTSSAYNGRNYCVPNYKESAVGYSMLCPKKLADKYNWDFSNVKSVYDLEPFMQEAAGDPDVGAAYLGVYFGCLALDKLAFIFDTTSDVPGAIDLTGDNTKIVNQYETEEFKKFCETMYRWNQAGYFSSDVATNTDPNTVHETDGDFVFDWWCTVPDNANSASQRRGYDVVAIPVTQNYLTSFSPLGSLQVIPASSKHPKEALKFLELLNTDQTLQDMVLYGIEGEHYTRNSDGTVHITNKDAYGIDGWQVANMMVPSLMDTDSPKKKELYQSFNDSGIESVNMGFVPSRENIDAEYTAVYNVVKQYVPLLNCGATDPATYLPEFISAMKAAGSDKMIADLQAQYDDFLSQKA